MTPAANDPASVWTPLVAAIGEPAATAYMHMGVAAGPNGVQVHLYKHRLSREYVNLDAAGNRYRYEGRAGYVRIEGATA